MNCKVKEVRICVTCTASSQHGEYTTKIYIAGQLESYEDGTVKLFSYEEVDEVIISDNRCCESVSVDDVSFE